jgi:hypothetical protein
MQTSTNKQASIITIAARTCHAAKLAGGQTSKKQQQQQQARTTTTRRTHMHWLVASPCVLTKTSDVVVNGNY